MGSSSTFTEFNVRQEQGKPHFIRLHDSVVKRLEGQLGRRQRGLLLGSIETGEGCTIAVEEFEPAVLIEERIRTWRAQPGSRRQPVGYYRAHDRSEFVLDAEDRALFERCFPEDQRLVLLVKPSKAEVGAAMFFLGEAGRLVADRATVEFPFNLRELGAEDTPAEPEPKPIIAPVKVVAARRTGLVWKIAIAAALVIASGFGLSALKVFDRQTAPSPPVSVAVVNPAPAAAPGNTLPAAPEAQPSQPPVPSPQKAAPARPETAPNKATGPVALPASPAAPAPQPVLVAQNPAPAATTPVQPAVEVPRPAPPADPPPPIRKEAAPTQAAPPPAVVSSPKPVESNAPVVSITPPRAIQQVTPELTGKALKSIVGEVVVRVKVYVDASGRVTSSEPVPGAASVDPAVTGAVSSAVKRWKFEPARRGSEKIPGDLVLSFVFRK